MWSYLEHVSLLLEGLTRILQDLSLDKVFEAKQQLTTPSLKLKHGHIAKPITTIQNIPFVTNEKGEIAPGILLYVTDGILPMLKVKIINCACFNPLLISYPDFLFKIFSSLR